MLSKMTRLRKVKKLTIPRNCPMANGSLPKTSSPTPQNLRSRHLNSQQTHCLDSCLSGWAYYDPLNPIAVIMPIRTRRFIRAARPRGVTLRMQQARHRGSSPVGSPSPSGRPGAVRVTPSSRTPTMSTLLPRLPSLKLLETC